MLYRPSRGWKNLPAFEGILIMLRSPEARQMTELERRRQAAVRAVATASKGRSPLLGLGVLPRLPPHLEQSLHTDWEALRGEALPSHPFTLLDDNTRLPVLRLSALTILHALWGGDHKKNGWSSSTAMKTRVSGTWVCQDPRGNLLLQKKLPSHLTWGFFLPLHTETSSQGPPPFLSINDGSTRLLYSSLHKNSHCHKTALCAPKHGQSSASLPRWNDLFILNTDQCSPLSLCETPVSTGVCRDQFSQDHYLSYVGNLQLAKWKHLALLCSPPGELRSHPGTTCSYILI